MWFTNSLAVGFIRIFSAFGVRSSYLGGQWLIKMVAQSLVISARHKMLLGDYLCSRAAHWLGKDFLRSKPQPNDSPCPVMLPFFSFHRFFYNRPFALLISSHIQLPENSNQYIPTDDTQGTPGMPLNWKQVQVRDLARQALPCFWLTRQEEHFFFVISIFYFLSEELRIRKIRTLLI